jgi:tetratricopeptide (TPR) repeat protein
LNRVTSLLAALAVVGCAHTPLEPVPAGATSAVELTDTPFFAQTIHQCGPAALATVLVDAGVETTPEQLAAQTYLPGRRGSLQLELVAAARRHRRVPYVIAPAASALFAELDAGHPVLVLQDLGVGPIHVWHYAVVVGYHRAPAEITLRSGTTRRLVMTYDDFARSWRKSGNWGFVALAPDVLPANAEASRYAESILPFETLGDAETARTAYATAATRWPDDPVALFGLAGAEHRLGDLSAAQASYERLLGLAPDNPIVLNNLAEVLIDRGCPHRAMELALAAQRGVTDDVLRAAVDDTLAKAAAAAPAADAADCAR